MWTRCTPKKGTTNQPKSMNWGWKDHFSAVDLNWQQRFEGELGVSVHKSTATSPGRVRLSSDTEVIMSWKIISWFILRLFLWSIRPRSTSSLLAINSCPPTRPGIKGCSYPSSGRWEFPVHAELGLIWGEFSWFLAVPKISFYSWTGQ